MQLHWILKPLYILYILRFFISNATYQQLEVCYLLFIQYLHWPPLLHHPACDNIRICRFLLYAGCAGRLPDRDPLFAHVQTSAGLLFCFMTISAALPWHPGPWPQSLILSGGLNFHTSADSFQRCSRTPKCCHSRFPGRQAHWVQGTRGNL